MDILFINEQKYTIEGSIESSMGILLLRQRLESEGFSADVYQGFAGEANAYIRKALASSDKPRIIGFYSNHNNIHLVEHSSAALKAAHPEVLIIAGGPQLIGLGENFLKNSGVDIGCVGECDDTLPQLMHSLLRGVGKKEDIKGIFFLTAKGEFIRTPDQELPVLDKSPWPDLIYAPELTGSGILPMLTGRCYPVHHEAANSRDVRFHSVDSVVAEIERNITQNHDLRCVNFIDDTFTLKKDRLQEFCDRFILLRKKYDFAWMCSGHVPTLHNRPELIKSMVDAGCIKIFFDVESGSGEIMEKFNKRSFPSMIEETIIMCAEQGINSTAGNIILGGPFETKESCEMSVSMIEELVRILPGRFDPAYFTYIHYPNTRIKNNPEEFGVSLSPEYLDCENEEMACSSTAAISQEELQQIKAVASRRLVLTMQEIYASGSIPDHTILADYRLKSRYGLFTRWYDYIYSRQPIDHSYWRMRASDSFFTSAELESGQGIPERCFELWLEVGFRNRRPFIGKYELSDLEYELLKLVNGKLTKSEILETAAARQGTKINSGAEAAAALSDMEARRWILYAKN